MGLYAKLLSVDVDKNISLWNVQEWNNVVAELVKSWQCIQEKVECIDYEKILKVIVTIHWISRKVKKKSHQYYPLIHRDYVEMIMLL